MHRFGLSVWRKAQVVDVPCLVEGVVSFFLIDRCLRKDLRTFAATGGWPGSACVSANGCQRKCVGQF